MNEQTTLRLKQYDILKEPGREISKHFYGLFFEQRGLSMEERQKHKCNNPAIDKFKSGRIYRKRGGNKLRVKMSANGSGLMDRNEQ